MNACVHVCACRHIHARTEGEMAEKLDLGTKNKELRGQREVPPLVACFRELLANYESHLVTQGHSTPTH